MRDDKKYSYITNALTFDLEDWYQSTFDINAPIRDVVLDQTGIVLEILAEAGVSATFFALGLVAEKFPDLVKTIAKQGHEIATHGYRHQLIFTQTPSEFEADLQRSIALLEDLTGQKVVGHRAPDFSITAESLWALDILREQSILYDSSIFPIKHRRYGIKRFQREIHYITPSSREFTSPLNSNNALIEFPLSTISLFGTNFPVCGGGYLRLMPYIVTRKAIKKLASEGMPAMVYMHPYEFDAQDLSTPIYDSENLRGKFLRCNQNLNRDKSASKLRRLLKDFEFASTKEVLKNLSLL